jgi:hypothetical protein
MTGSERTDRLNAELHDLLLQDIARGAVMIFESLPGKAGTVFSHGYNSTWERACDLLMQVDIAQPLRFDELIKEFVPADKDTRRPAMFKLAQNVDDIAEYFSKRPPPVEGDLTVALSVWIEIAAFHRRVPLRQQFEFEYVRKYRHDDPIDQFLKEEGIVYHNQFIDEARRVMDHLVAAGYASKAGNSYMWSKKVIPAADMLLE